MYAKFFFERFWEGEQKKELFVCMPFHDSFDSKFNKINNSAKEVNFDRAVRVKEDWSANVITDKIFDGIANSKMLLFDLSDDPVLPCKYLKQANVNVLYELGIANAIREPQDILLIRKTSSTKIPFDISGMTINEYEGDLTVEWLVNKLKDALKNQEWHKSKRVKAAAKSIDGEAIELMYNYGRNPEDFNHFNTRGAQAEVKMSVLRLIDLGIIWFASKCEGEYREHAFRWTSFGHEVMKHLNIQKLSMDEFKKLPQYQSFLEGRKKYQENKRKSQQKFPKSEK